MPRYNLTFVLSLLLLALFLSPSTCAAQKLPAMSEAGRTSWPELSGMPGGEVEITLKASHPDWKIEIIPDGSMVTMDYREDRVRIWIDEDGKVARAPTVG
jgi:hypothetical protein